MSSDTEGKPNACDRGPDRRRAGPAPGPFNCIRQSPVSPARFCMWMRWIFRLSHPHLSRPTPDAMLVLAVLAQLRHALVYAFTTR